MEDNIGQKNQFLISQTSLGEIELEYHGTEETFWLTQTQLADIYDVQEDIIKEHIKNIYFSKELDENSTIRKFQIVQTEGNHGVKQQINHYNLDVALSVGYRVNSQKATEFRQWASKLLKQYLLDDDSLNTKELRKKRISILENIDEHKVFLSKKPYQAQLIEFDAVFLITKGSILVAPDTSIKRWQNEKRVHSRITQLNKLINHEIIKKQADGNYIMLRDYATHSKKSAAWVVAGYHAKPSSFWKTDYQQSTAKKTKREKENTKKFMEGHPEECCVFIIQIDEKEYSIHHALNIVNAAKRLIFTSEQVGSPIPTVLADASFKLVYAQFSKEPISLKKSLSELDEIELKDFINGNAHNNIKTEVRTIASKLMHDEAFAKKLNDMKEAYKNQGAQT